MTERIDLTPIIITRDSVADLQLAEDQAVETAEAEGKRLFCATYRRREGKLVAELTFAPRDAE